MTITENHGFLCGADDAHIFIAGFGSARRKPREDGRRTQAEDVAVGARSVVLNSRQWAEINLFGAERLCRTEGECLFVACTLIVASYRILNGDGLSFSHAMVEEVAEDRFPTWGRRGASEAFGWMKSMYFDRIIPGDQPHPESIRLASRCSLMTEEFKGKGKLSSRYTGSTTLGRLLDLGGVTLPVSATVHEAS